MRPLVLTLVAAAALSSGCGGSSSADAPKTLPPASASPSPAAASTATPTGIAAPTPEGASEFARYFYAQITAAFAARDPKLIQDLSLPGCSTCKLYADSVAAVRDKNQTVKGGVFSVSFAVAPQSTSSTTARVDVGWSFGGATFYDAAGKVVETHPAERGVEEQVRLQRQADHWLVAEVTRTRTRS